MDTTNLSALFHSARQLRKKIVDSGSAVDLVQSGKFREEVLQTSLLCLNKTVEQFDFSEEEPILLEIDSSPPKKRAKISPANDGQNGPASSGSEAPSANLWAETCGEIVSLLANCAHFSVEAQNEIRSSPVLAALLKFLRCSVSLELKSRVARAVANLCHRKEGAVAILQSKQSLNTLFSIIANEKGDTSAESEDSVCNLKLHCLRAIRLISFLSRNFCRAIIEEDGVYFLGKALTDSKQFTKLVDEIVTILAQLSTSSAKDCGLQLARSESVSTIIDLVCEGRQLMKEGILFLRLISHSSEIRGVFLNEKGLERVTEELLQSSSTRSQTKLGGVTEYWLTILRFLCQEASARFQMRTSGCLNVMVQAFFETKLGSTIHDELCSGFLFFIHDDKGSEYLLSRPQFLQAISSDLFTYQNPNAEICRTEAVLEMDYTTIYRPDSPGYLKCKEAATEEVSASRTLQFPLSKDFTQDAANFSGTSSPNSPFSACSWSPGSFAGSVFSSLGSPEMSSDISMDASDAPMSQCGFSPPTETSKAPGQLDRSFSEPSSEHRSGDNEDLIRRTIASEIRFLTQCSHKDTKFLKLLATKKLVHSLIHCVKNVEENDSNKCVGILKRCAGCVDLLESLLDMNFHVLLRENLCESPCLMRKFGERCSSCKKKCKIGCDLLAKYGFHVNSGYGVGELARRIICRGEKHMALQAASAAAYLVTYHVNKRRLLVGYQGLPLMMNRIRELDVLYQNDIVTALKGLLQLAIRPMDKKTIVRSDVKQSSTCLCDLQTFSKEEEMIIFEFPSDDSKFEIPRNALLEFSEFYQAMLRVGGFSESAQGKFTVEDTQEYSAHSLKILLHFIQGCRNCSAVPINSVEDCIGLLYLADKHDSAELKSLAIDEAWKLMSGGESTGNLLSVSLLMMNNRLFSVCLLHLQTMGNGEAIFKTLSFLNETQLLNDFCLELENRIVNSL